MPSVNCLTVNSSCQLTTTHSPDYIVSGLILNHQTIDAGLPRVDAIAATAIKYGSVGYAQYAAQEYINLLFNALEFTQVYVY